MLAETIWAATYHGIAMTLVVSVLAIIFHVYGRVVIGLLRLPTSSPSISIAAGLAVAIFFAWTARRFSITAGPYITAFLLGAVVIFALKTIWRIRSATREGRAWGAGLFQDSQVLPLFALALSIQTIVALNSPTQLVGTILNKDIYSWALLADQLLGQTDFYNIFHAGRWYYDVHIGLDAWGTTFVLALVSKFVGLPALEATPCFQLFCSTLICFAVFEIVRKAFNLPRFLAFGVALLTGAGSFLFYIAYNNFYGQLLATFFYLTTIIAIMEIAAWDRSVIKPILMCAFPAVGLLISYQSGFMVFTAFSVCFCIIYWAATQWDRAAGVKVNARSVGFAALPVVGGTLLAFILLPTFALHMANRTRFVADVSAGWPLPLVFPGYLFSTPFLFPFPAVAGNAYHYVAAVAIIAALCFLAYSAGKRSGHKTPATVLAFGVFACFSIAVYLLTYAINGGAYQTWKLAAFVLLPMSFVLNAILIETLNRLSARRMLEYAIAAILAFGCIGLLFGFPRGFSVEALSPRIEQLKAAKQGLLGSDVKNLILATTPYSETMAAFTVLAKDFRLFPLTRTYLPAVDPKLIKDLDPRETRILVSAKCYADRAKDRGRGQSGYIALGYGEVGSDKISFGAEGASCAASNGLRLVEGFGYIEPWGNWTEGKKARLVVRIPPSLLGKNLHALFVLTPFGAQSFSVTANGNLSGPYSIKSDMTLAIEIPAAVSQLGEVEFEFLIDQPRRPRDIDPRSPDARELGLGFVNLVIKSRD